MASGSGAIRAGRAFVELFADDNKLYRALDTAAARLKSFGMTTAKIGGTIGGVGAAVLAPLAKPFNDALARGKAIASLSDRFGQSAEKLSGLAYAAEKAGMPVDEFGSTLDALATRISNAADGGDELFRRLGINARGLLNLPIDQQLAKIADGVSRVKNSEDQIRVAGELGLAPLLKTLKKGSGAFAELNAEAERVGATMSGENAQAAKAIGKAWTDTTLAIKYGFLSIGTALLPSAAGIASFSILIKEGAIAAGQWVRENRGLVIGIAAVGIALVAAGASIAAFGAVAGAVGAGISALIVVAKAAAAVLLLMFSPIVLQVALVAAAVGGLGYIFATQTEAGRAMSASLSEGFTGIKNTAVEAWGGITAAIGRGDLKAAGEVAVAGLELAWAQGMVALTRVWVEFKNSVVDGWHDVTDALARGVANLASLGEFVANGFDIDKASEWNNELKDGIKQQREELDKANKAFREGQVKQAKDKLDSAASRFRSAITAAKGGEPDAEGNGVFVQALGRAAEIAKRYAGRMPNTAQLFESQKGTFSGPIAQQLGYGDNTAKRQLAAIEGVNQKANDLKVLPKIGKDIAKVADSLKFK